MLIALFVLKASVAALMIIFGVHQFVHPDKWQNYIPKWTERTYGVASESIIRFHALGNLILAIFLISSVFPLAAAWAVFIWWAATLPFSFMEDWRNGVRDLMVSAAVLAIIYLIA